MEEKIGYAIVSLKDYENLIRENEKLNYSNRKLVEEKEKTETQFQQIESAIFNKIYNSETYDIKNYDEINQYHHNELVKAFNSYGYTDSNRINHLISKLIEKYNAEEIVSVEEL